MCNKYKEILNHSFNNSIPLMIKSAKKMNQINEKEALNKMYFYIRIPPFIIKIFLIIFTTVSIFYNKYIITSGIMILTYTLLNYFFDLSTYPQEINIINILSLQLSYKYDIKWLKIYDVEIKDNTKKKDVKNYINFKNEEIKKEYNFNDEQLKVYVALNDDEIYDELKEIHFKYNIIIYNAITKKKIIKKLLYLIYFFGITNKVYNSGFFNNVWFFDDHNILYSD
jgi:hypothetical protein